MKRILFILLALLFAFYSGYGNAAQTKPKTGKIKRLEILAHDYRPLSFSEKGRATGLDVEVVREILKRNGQASNIKIVKWNKGYKELQEKPNVVFFSVGMSSERKHLFHWVGPVGFLDINLYAKKGSGIVIKGLDEARRVPKIATVKTYFSDELLTDKGFTNLDRHDSSEEAVKRLLKGEVQLFSCNQSIMGELLQKTGAAMDDVEIVYNVFAGLSYIAFSKDTPEITVKKWQRTLDKMKKDGTFARIFKKWLPTDTAPAILQLVTEDYPPVTFMKDGKATGFVTDMVREIAGRVSVPDNIRVIPWANAYNMALINPNVVLFSAERTENRENLFNWVGPVGKNSAIFYAKKGSDIKIGSMDDARKVEAIATTSNWFTEQYLKERGFANLVSSSQPTANVKQLMEGKVQLSIFTDITIPDIVKDAGYTMDDLEPVLTVSNTYFYIALSRGTHEGVVKEWQSALDGIKKDGLFEKIYRRYLPKADIADLLIIK